MIYLNGIVFFFLYYGVCLWAFFQGENRRNSIRETFKKLSWFHIIIILAFILGSFLLTYCLRSQDRFIYFMNWSRAWKLTIAQSNYMSTHNLFDVMKSVALSINYGDYNLFLPSIMAMPVKILGDSYTKYTLILQAMFFIPSVIIQAFVVLKLNISEHINKSFLFTLTIVLAIIFPANYYVFLRGFNDVAMLIPFSILMYLFADYDFRKFSLSKNIAIGLMFFIAWLSRRYLIYFILGYLLALLFKAIVTLIKDKNLSDLKNVFKSFLTIASSSLGLLLLFFHKFVINAFVTKYSEMFIGYNKPLLEKISMLSYSFGDMCICFLIIVGLLCFIYKKNRLNYISMIVLVFMECFLFFKTQAMYCHHRTILNLPVFIIIMMLFTFSDKDTSYKKPVIKTVKLIFLFLFICNFLYVFIQIPSNRNVINYIQYTYSHDIPALNNATDNHNLENFFSERYIPPIRDDIDEINRMVEFLNSKTLNTDKKVYVLALSPILNSSILQNILVPKKLKALNNLVTDSNVDLWHGFCTEFFDAHYVVTTTPVQLILKKEHQQVIVYLSENIQDSSTYIGKHFKKIESFNLDNNTTAMVFEKISDWTEDDVEKIRIYFDNLYPDNKELFADRIHL